jgi:ABC-2 type transport system ATP-binding protein
MSTATASRPGLAKHDGHGIHLDAVSVSLSGKEILHQLTGELRAQSIGLLGPNGAGKSTLIRTLMGVHRPTSGSAGFLGIDERPGPGLRAAVGYMPEHDAFIGDMTAVRMVRYMAELAGLPPHEALERAHEALFFVGLGEARYRQVGGFSTGMKQLVKLAQAIVHAPRVIILDEPTNGLDPGGRMRMLELVTQIRDSGQAMVLLSSHLLPDVETVCDQVLILHRGRVAGTCDLEAERNSASELLEVELVAENPAFLDQLGGLGCHVNPKGPRQAIVTLVDGVGAADVVRAARDHGAAFRTLERSRDSLHEIFLRVLEDADGGA